MRLLEIIKTRCNEQKYKKRVNVLENEINSLKGLIFDDTYKAMINKLGEPTEIERLKKENKRLRLKIKGLKELLKEEK